MASCGPTHEREGSPWTDGLVTIVIPCRNEVRHIRLAIESATNQVLDQYKSEIIVADGMSEDGTREIIHDCTRCYPRVRLVDNPQKIKSTGLNKAIRQCNGSIVVIMDAHSEYPLDYVIRLVEALRRLDADNVGGVIESVAEDSGLIGTAVAEAMSNRFGVGDSLFRIGGASEMQVDTVPFGCYRRDVFNRVGFFDEELVRNQDDEFNSRLIRAGGSIWLIPKVKSRYFVRNSIQKLGRMLFQYGLFKPLVNKKVGRVATLRQFAPPLFVLTLGMGLLLTFNGGISALFIPVLGLHLIFGSAFGIRAASLKGRLQLAVILPFVFLYMHLAYGMGYLIGFVRYGLFGGRVKVEKVQLNR